MILGKVLGKELYLDNPHWVNVYGRLLDIIGALNPRDEEVLIDIAETEIKEDQENKAYDFLEDRGLYMEGFTRRATTPIFVKFCKDFRDENTALAAALKLEKIMKLKKGD